MITALATAHFGQGQVDHVSTAAEVPKIARPIAIFAPRPRYPYEAFSKGITGRGVFVLDIDPKDGLIRSVAVARSTGSPILDNAAMSTFAGWRLKPGTVSRLNVPVIFSLPKKSKNSRS
jgi:TonB family protein